MTIEVTERGTVCTNVDSSTYDIASVALTAGKFYTAFVYSSIATGTAPSVTGIAVNSGTGTLTMTKRTTTGDTETFSGGVRRVEVWYGLCTESGTATMRATLNGTSTNTCMLLHEWDGVDTSGTNGANAIQEAVCKTNGSTSTTSLEVSGLTGFADAGNRPVGFAVHRANEATTHDTVGGYTELFDGSHNSPSGGVCLQWHSTSQSDRTPGFSWTTSSANGGIALQMAIEPSTPSFPFGALHRASVTDVPDEAPRPRHELAFLFSPFTPVEPEFPFEVLARRQLHDEPSDEPRPRRDLAFVPPPPDIAPPPFPFEVLRRARPESVPDEGRPARPIHTFLFGAPPVPPPAFQLELLRGHRATEPDPDEPHIRRGIEFLFPPPPPPPPFNVATLPPSRLVEQPEPEMPRFPRLTDWYTFPPAQSVAVVTPTAWSREVRFEAGDELRVTVEFPDCLDPQVRVGLGFRRVQ